MASTFLYRPDEGIGPYLTFLREIFFLRLLLGCNECLTGQTVVLFLYVLYRICHSRKQFEV